MRKYGVVLDFGKGIFEIGNTSLGMKGTGMTSFKIFAIIDRDEQVMQLLRLAIKAAPEPVQKRLEEFLSENLDVFKMEDEQIPPNNFYVQAINLTTKTPVYVRQYRLPLVHKKEMKIQVKKLLEQGVLRPSTSSYNNPN